MGYYNTNYIWREAYMTAIIYCQHTFSKMIISYIYLTLNRINLHNSKAKTHNNNNYRYFLFTRCLLSQKSGIKSHKKDSKLYTMSEEPLQDKKSSLRRD